jgi:2',3'-cyclic-nucleotide 2'-phosphodiesterase (5'-nucleotidase family)
MSRQFAIGVILMVLLISCRTTIHIADVSKSNYKVSPELDSIYPSDEQRASSEIWEMILPYKQELEGQMQRIIGEVPVELPKKQPESSMTNWIGDVIYRQGAIYLGRNPDFSLMNHGGLRLPSVPAGVLTVGKVFELMPFDNNLTILEMTGETVEEMFAHIIKRGGGWPISETVKVTFNEIGLASVEIHGMPIDQHKVYTVATSSFLADGGDGLDMLLDLPRTDFPVMIRDLIIHDVESRQARGIAVSSVSEGRMIKVK